MVIVVPSLSSLAVAAVDESHDPAPALQSCCNRDCKAVASVVADAAPMTATRTATDGLLSVFCGDHDPTIWADDARLDAVVPGWRLSVEGRDAIDRQLRKWFRDPGEVEEVRRQPTSSGEIVEVTITWVEAGIPHAARQVHVLDFDEDDRIVVDHMWCGGRWSASLLAEMEAARDAR
jgi:hypothetical protein